MLVINIGYFISIYITITTSSGGFFRKVTDNITFLKFIQTHEKNRFNVSQMHWQIHSIILGLKGIGFEFLSSLSLKIEKSYFQK